VKETCRIALQTHGCKLNQAETESLARAFEADGYRVVPADTEADVYLLNSCSVTHTADAKARQWLRKIGRVRPGCLIVATGCYAERDAQALSQVPGVRVVAGNTAKDDLVSLVTAALGAAPITDTATEIPVTPRYRAMVKIQDGCRSFCAYCVVPLVRPVESSRTADEIVREVQELVGAGYREIVLTGTKVGTYRDADTNLSNLLCKLLAKTDVMRLRLSSIQPQEVTPELIGLWDDPRLCRHFHLSLQSGSDAVLRRMNRRYTTVEYAAAVALIRERVPDVAVTTDVIAGFPGETAEEFNESYRFCRAAGFARLHVFPYSPRTGTAAAVMPPVSAEVKRKRTQELLKLLEY
jgi:threonylcarbamoyladenosine tRNA methylthiotransferase MtaB